MSSYRELQCVKYARRFLGLEKALLRRAFSANADQPKGVVIGVYEKEDNKPMRYTENGVLFDDAVGGKIMSLIQERGMDGTPGKGLLFNGLDGEFQTVAVVGMGPADAGYDEIEELDEGMENTRIAAGTGARALQLQGMAEVHVDGMEYTEQAAEGAALAVWRYNANKRKKDRMITPKLHMYGKGEHNDWVRGLFKAESQNLARRLSDTPANQMTPSIFSQSTVDSLCSCGINVEVRSMDWIEDKNLDSFLMIAKGSCEPPLLMECTYSGTAPEDKPVLILGQGLTFHSGGLCLKKKDGMAEYRGAMAGAAVCVGVLRAAAALSLPLNISVVMPLCEHVPSGMAVKCGDVVTLLNGTSLGIRDVDKAPVVMMADPLLYAQTNYKPRMVISIGSIAKGVQYGLGGSATGLWTNSNFVAKQFKKAGSITGDRVWRMPLFRYFKQIVSKNYCYDLSNCGRGPASSCLAAAVLHTLVPCLDWAHLDIRGTGLLSNVNTLPYLLHDSMTGRPTRTIVQFLFQLACSQAV